MPKWLTLFFFVFVCSCNKFEVKNSQTLTKASTQTPGEADERANPTLPRAPCLPSGSDLDIQKALQESGDKAILCQNSVFRLKNPIHFNAPDQEISTQDFPKGNGRAKILIDDPKVPFAIHGMWKPNARIRNVIIDGQLPRSIPAGDETDAMVILGGASGQVVEWSRLMNTRGWSSLHLPSSAGACTSARIENNEIGPSGSPDLFMWADGISLDCKNSVVKDNYIFDATDGGIVVFGAAGSLIQNNTVEALTRVMLGGILMVDRHDFSGTRVEGNSIKATGTTIKIALGMGPKIWWACNGGTNRGAQVNNNKLYGAFMGYGFVASGVADWVAQGNQSFARHSGELTGRGGCKGQGLARLGPFIRDPETTSGNFQAEFQNGHLDNSLEFKPSGPVRISTQISVE